MSETILTQTGTVDTALLHEDETRPNGLHSLEGVAYLVGKKVEDLAEIEVLESVGCFHKARDGAGYYLVDVRNLTCSCPGYRFRGHCRHVAHVKERIKNEATSEPRKMSKDELASRKARIDARNKALAAKRVAKKATGTNTGFNMPDEALA